LSTITSEYAGLSVQYFNESGKWNFSLCCYALPSRCSSAVHRQAAETAWLVPALSHLHPLSVFVIPIARPSAALRQIATFFLSLPFSRRDIPGRRLFLYHDTEGKDVMRR